MPLKENKKGIKGEYKIVIIYIYIEHYHYLGMINDRHPRYTTPNEKLQHVPNLYVYRSINKSAIKFKYHFLCTVKFHTQINKLCVCITSLTKESL